MKKIISIMLVMAFGVSTSALAEDTVVVVPMGDDLMPIVIPGEEGPNFDAEFLDEVFGKPIIWNRGWDTSIGNRTKIDRSVPLTYTGISPADFGSSNAIRYTPRPQILHWGLQKAFTTTFPIYSKSVVLIDKGTHVEGGPFEWTLNAQNSVTLHNIYYHGSRGGWLRTWYAPVTGDKVWFFLMSDDERFSTLPVTFTWPSYAGATH